MVRDGGGIIKRQQSSHTLAVRGAEEAIVEEDGGHMIGWRAGGGSEGWGRPSPPKESRKKPLPQPPAAASGPAGSKIPADLCLFTEASRIGRFQTENQSNYSQLQFPPQPHFRKKTLLTKFDLHSG